MQKSEPPGCPDKTIWTMSRRRLSRYRATQRHEDHGCLRVNTRIQGILRTVSLVRMRCATERDLTPLHRLRSGAKAPKRRSSSQPMLHVKVYFEVEQNAPPLAPPLNPPRASRRGRLVPPIPPLTAYYFYHCLTRQIISAHIGSGEANAVDNPPPPETRPNPKCPPKLLQDSRRAEATPKGDHIILDSTAHSLLTVRGRWITKS